MVKIQATQLRINPKFKFLRHNLATFGQKQPFSAEIEVRAPGYGYVSCNLNRFEGRCVEVAQLVEANELARSSITVMRP